MHDLDRQQLEQYEHEGLPVQYATGRPGEAREMELAAQFLEITSEAELGQFLSGLARSAATLAGRGAVALGRGAVRVANDPFIKNTVIPTLVATARNYGPVTARLAAEKLGSERVLPGLSNVVEAGTQVLVDNVPGLKQADELFGGELEGLSGEDREFEAARSYVRFADDALQRALQAPPRVPPSVAAEIVLGEAARTHMPGLVPFVPEIVREASADPDSGGGAISGRWVRQGSSLVIDLG